MYVLGFYRIMFCLSNFMSFVDFLCNHNVVGKHDWKKIISVLLFRTEIVEKDSSLTCGVWENFTGAVPFPLQSQLTALRCRARLCWHC